MSKASDYRKILGVSEKATTDEIKSAYRKLAKKYHPDTNSSDPEAERKFKEVNEAFQHLKDKGASGAGGIGGDYGSFSDTDMFNEIFDVILKRGYTNSYPPGMDPGFGAAFRRGEASSKPSGGIPEKGTDREMTIKVSLEDAFAGIQQVIEIADDEKIRIRIPAGVLDGAQLRIKGHGTKGKYGGADGDLILTLRLLEHPDFILDGRNLKTRIDVPFTLAAAGGKLKYLHLDGSTRMIDLPAFSKGETTLIAKGYGWPSKDGETAGHLIIDVKSILPANLTDRQKKLLEDFAETMPEYRSERLATVI